MEIKIRSCKSPMLTKALIFNNIWNQLQNSSQIVKLSRYRIHNGIDLFINRSLGVLNHEKMLHLFLYKRRFIVSHTRPVFALWYGMQATGSPGNGLVTIPLICSIIQTLTINERFINHSCRFN